MYSSAITIRERNKKTLGQNREKRDKRGENGEREGRRMRGRRVGGEGECGSECGTRDEDGETEISRFLVLN